MSGLSNWSPMPWVRTKCLLRDADLLPAEVIRGAKRRFEVPLRGWLTHDLLGRPNAFERTWIDGRFIEGLLNNPPATNFNWDALMYSLLVLELWLEQHAVGNQQTAPQRRVA